MFWYSGGKKYKQQLQGSPEKEALML